VVLREPSKSPTVENIQRRCYGEYESEML
jgi:hypothetical protein